MTTTDTIDLTGRPLSETHERISVPRHLLRVGDVLDGRRIDSTARDCAADRDGELVIDMRSRDGVIVYRPRHAIEVRVLGDGEATTNWRAVVRMGTETLRAIAAILESAPSIDRVTTTSGPIIAEYRRA